MISNGYEMSKRAGDLSIDDVARASLCQEFFHDKRSDLFERAEECLHFCIPYDHLLRFPGGQ